MKRNRYKDGRFARAMTDEERRHIDDLREQMSRIQQKADAEKKPAPSFLPPPIH